MLQNVSVKDADLEKARPDIKNYFLYEGQASFRDEIAEAKRMVFREIKDIERAKYPDKDEKELSDLVDTLTDMPDEPVKDRVVYTALYLIFQGNNMLDLANSYLRQALDTTLSYNLDSEYRRDVKPVIFGR